jgi:hypothetical protein
MYPVTGFKVLVVALITARGVEEMQQVAELAAAVHTTTHSLEAQ